MEEQKDLYSIPTPFFLVDRHKIARNCERMAERASSYSLQLRPHVKTHKTLEAAAASVSGGKSFSLSVLRKGAVVTSTLGEAEMMIKEGKCGDVLFAVPLPVYDAPKMRKCRELHSIAKQQGGNFHIMIDTLDQYEALINEERTQKGEGTEETRWSVFVEIDSGYHRDGIESEDALDLLKIVASPSAEVSFMGIYTHGGHSYQIEGGNRREAARQEIETMRSLKSKMDSLHLRCPYVSIGSTPSLTFNWSGETDPYKGITEIHPGNYIYFDVSQYNMGACSSLDDIACCVVTTVLSHYPRRREILVDAGALALSKDLGQQKTEKTHVSTWGVVAGHPTWNLCRISQEEGVIKLPEEEELSSAPIGSRLFILPNHSCLTAACFAEAHVLDSSQSMETIVSVWKTFPRVWG